MEWVNVVLAVFTFIITILLSIIGYFLIRHLSEMQRTREKVEEIHTRQQVQQAKIDNIQKELDDVKKLLTNSLYP